ncbi:beta-lactamase class A [Chitinophaga niastensis]|uniref:Beta-lactamase n=1 Tax=Chitinophaga niastensis TaxID=536980 RepID=A0A2P8HPT6_CHINA|nr:class A beta-lactamase, subclass A2 [Chitinophaga niastensis]PSL48243.1 beta-lactamase class A [Chitinophaga niastensis]
MIRYKTLYFPAIMAIFLLLSGLSSGQQTLRQQIAAISKNIPAKVGVYAMVLETGDTVSYNRDQQFPMQSVYKFPIAMAILDQVDKKKFTLDQPVMVNKSDIMPRGVSPIREKYPVGNVAIPLRELLQYNISASDGTACDVLLRLLGGTTNANTYVRQLGVKQMTIATTEKEQQVNDEMVQYRNWSTPAAMTALLTIFYEGQVLSDSSNALLLDLMITSGPGAKRIKGLLPPGTVVAHKTGTSGTAGGLTRATNDAGIITLPNGHHLAIAIFVADAKADQDEREATIAKITKAAWDHWTK